MLVAHEMPKEVRDIHWKETSQKLIDRQMELGYTYTLMFFVKENTLNLSYDEIRDSLCEDRMPQGVEFYYPHILLTPEYAPEYVENGLNDLAELMSNFLESLFEYSGDCDLTRIQYNLKKEERKAKNAKRV